jgi:hypothetical protein
MKVNSFFELMGAIVALAMLTDVVTSKNTAKIVSSSGKAFSEILKSAQGK